MSVVCTLKLTCSIANLHQQLISQPADRNSLDLSTLLMCNIIGGIGKALKMDKNAALYQMDR